MFDISKILKRAWTIVWNYKILWIFGFLLALTGGGAGSNGGGGSSGFSSRFNNNFNNPSRWNFGNQWQGRMDELGSWFNSHFGTWFATQQSVIHTFIWIGVAVFVFAILVGLLLSLVRYPAETAILRMVDDHEQTGSKVNFKQGWKLGWNHRAFRVWLVDLLLSLPMLVLAILIMGSAALMAFNFTGSGPNPVMSGLFVVGIILFFLLLLPTIVLSILLNLLRQFVVRFTALEDLSMGESFKQGWSLLKQNFKHAILMWLVMVGVGIAIGFAMVLVVLLLVPAYAILAIPGAIVAAIPGAIGFGITSIFNPQVLPWIIGGLAALPFFFMVVFSPVTFVTGLISLFKLNVWTLTFRQFKSTIVPPLPVIAEEAKPIEE